MNEHLKKLLAQRTAKQEAMQKLLDTASAESRSLTKDEGEQYDALEREFDSLTTDIARTEKQIERDQKLDEPVRTPIHSGGERIDDGEPAAEDVYQRAFWKANKGEALTDEEVRSLNIGTDAKGGYLVPQTFADTIIEKQSERSPMRSVATVSTSMSTENLPVEGDDVTASWVDEEGTYAESDPTIGQVTLDAYKAGCIVKVTDEALQDTVPAIEGYVAMKFSKATTKAEEAAFVSGNGTGKPTGVLNTAETGVTAASATAFTADEIIGLKYALDEDYEVNASWMMNRNTLKMVRLLKDGNGDYIWSKGFNGEPDTLDGKPIIINKHMPDVAASAAPIAFGDFSYYHIKDRSMMTLKRLDEKYADTGHVGFRVDKRVDGKLVLAEAVQKLVMAAV